MQTIHILGLLALTCTLVQGQACLKTKLSDGESLEFTNSEDNTNCWMVFRKRRSATGNLVLSCPEFELDPKCKRSRLVVKGSETKRFCKSQNVNVEEDGNVMKIRLAFRASAQIGALRCTVSVQETTMTSTQPPPPSNTTNSCQCGIAKRGQRIVGGEETQINEYPWQALLRQTNSDFPFCGGTLISEDWVLTAAHCVTGEENSPGFAYVSLGEHDVRLTTESEVIDSEILRIIVHPNYSSRNVDNDFALIQLKDKIKFDDSTVVRPACLPNEDLTTRTGQDVVVTGWGTIRYEGRASEFLQEVTLKLVDFDQCETRLNTALTDNMFCAYEDGKDSCQGDSGGPLIYAETTFYDVIGVVSWGYGCASPNLPGVYANVHKARAWIDQYVGEPTCARPGL